MRKIQRSNNNTRYSYYNKCRNIKEIIERRFGIIMGIVITFIIILFSEFYQSLKQRQATLYNPIDEVNDFLTTVLVIASDDNVHQAV